MLQGPVETGQYVSLALSQTARDAGISRSMGSTGDCFDNAVAESFFATLKKELVHRRSWPTRHELTSEIFEYIEAFYNRVRRHSTLGMLAPVEFENSTLSSHRPSLAAARLGSSQDQIINHELLKAQPCPSKRGNSTNLAPSGQTRARTIRRSSTRAGRFDEPSQSPARSPPMSPRPPEQPKRRIRPTAFG